MTQPPPRWVVVAIASYLETVDPDDLAKHVKRLLPRAEIYIPAAVTKVGRAREVRELFSGYVFVKFDPRHDYRCLKETKYLDGVVYTGGRMATLSQAELDRIRSQTEALVDNSLALGDQVSVSSGLYQGMRGTVMDVRPDAISVEFRLRSMCRLATLPRGFVTLVVRAADRPPEPPRPVVVSPLQTTLQLPAERRRAHPSRVALVAGDNEPPARAEFRGRVQAAVVAAGLTRTEIAELIGSTHTSVRRALKGDAHVGPHVLLKIATSLGVPETLPPAAAKQEDQHHMTQLSLVPPSPAQPTPPPRAELREQRFARALAAQLAASHMQPVDLAARLSWPAKRVAQLLAARVPLRGDVVVEAVARALGTSVEALLRAG